MWKRIVTIIQIVYISQSTILDSNTFGIKETTGSSAVSAVGVQGITDSSSAQGKGLEW